MNLNMEQILEKLKTPQNKERIKIFCITVIASMIIHFQLYALMITGPDTLINSIYHKANIWEVMILRFGLYFVQLIKGNIVSPVLVTLISSMLLGITVNIVIDTLEIKNKYFKYIISLLFVVAPNISSTLTFFYCSDGYILGLLLASLAVFIIRKYSNKKWPVLLSSFLLMLSISMYQTYLSVTMVLCVATLILDVLNKKETKQILITILKYSIMGVIGVVSFYFLAHLIVNLSGLHVSNYNGANSIGLETLTSIPRLLPESYQSFFNYYFNDKMIPNTIWGTNILYIIIFAALIASIAYIIIKNKIYSKKVNTILLLIFILIAPICFGIIELIAPDVDIHVLMACSMIYIFPILFKIIELLPKNTIEKVIKTSMVLCSIGIIWIYTWQDNASYIAIKTMQNQAQSTVSRIVTQIEQLDEYTPEMPVLFLGGLQGNQYLNKENTVMADKNIYKRSWGFISETPTIWWGNLDSWNKILYEYEGVNMKLVSEWDSGEIFATEEYKSMKYYPDKDSIKVIKNTVVVKLSD